MNLVNINEESLNIVNKINHFNNPNRVLIPIIKEQTFRINDYIYKNNSYGPYVSSVSGRVSGSKRVIINNSVISAIEVINDFQENSKTKRRKAKIVNKDQLLNELKRYYLDDVLNKFLEIKKIKNIIISSVDEECYSATEFIMLSNYCQEILDTADFIANILQIKNIKLAIKNTSFNAIKTVKSTLGTYPSFNLILLPSLYLIGRKEFLCEFLGLDSKETLVLKASEIFDIYTSLIKGKDVTEHIITISGTNMKNGLIVSAKLYTPIIDILKEYKIKLDSEIYANGYLGGEIINLEDAILTKSIHTIVVNKKDSEGTSECINCGACQKICPLKINAKRYYFLKMKNKKCLHCGLCTYICPANLKLKDVVGGIDEKV